ncbi:YbaB/EbfC family nucleoid-associated protein [Oceanispirochaeta crateris]|jgi:DNA-binding YbaB/EbfC family protein|uniref:Nucleoid-associated protein EXM22_14120 n=1 Tax=Oceanispirochaeta crateris TaxID=2518645 RepID=A0A5C1QR75_9SPIO|nr:YbaB/EbfC family nucleoid-associated protein [Oceanispirochaeta crateris]QEN09066.1 YbaB/EbfC family nucleoid-associated protein [Oceanispirochaeta crateris]
MSFNPMDMMKNLQEMQGKMGEVQEKLKTIEAEGSSGGGLVKVRINGQMEITGLTIDPIAVDPRDVKMLEELIVSSCSAATIKIKEKIREEVSELSGMPLPPGFPGI